MDPCTGRQQLQIFWRHSRHCCLWILSIMQNGFVGSGWRCFWRNVPAKFGWQGKSEGKETSDRRLIWESAWAKRWEVTSQSCQIQPSWLWFAGCRMARISFYPQTTPSHVHWCEALGGADWFHQQKWMHERAIHSNIEVQVHLAEGQIGRRLYGNIYTPATDNGPHIWPDFVQLVPFKCFQVEPWTRSEDIFGRNEVSSSEGDWWGHN